MDRLFVDTGAWFAFANRSDPDHQAVRQALRQFRGRLVTSNFVFDETVTLCLARQGHALACRIGGSLLSASLVDLVRVSPEDERLAWELFLGRADQEYSFTDCTSFVLLRRLGIEQAAAVGGDFAREGFRVLPALA